MARLKVPYRTQRDPRRGCGGAALEMVLNTLQPNRTFSQVAFVRAYARPAAADDRHREIGVDDIIKEARRRGLHAGWGRVSPQLGELAGQIASFIDRGLPLMAVQRFPLRPELGHYRVITGIEGVRVRLHDPSKRFGGRSLDWPLADLRNAWRTSGWSVTGGVAVWIAPEDLGDAGLAPDRPNHWALGAAAFDAGDWPD